MFKPQIISVRSLDDDQQIAFETQIGDESELVKVRIMGNTTPAVVSLDYDSYE